MPPPELPEPTENESQDLHRTVARAHPVQIGRYRIERVLGEGGFGIVFLARDEQLDRLVAIKVSHSRLISESSDATPYLEEAKIVAQLDHPHIVPVHDVGSTAEVPFYSVSKYVDGCDLSVQLRQKRYRPRESAELVAKIAEALHFAHKRGLVHRDVKPANILIDGRGKPYLVDFGLALRDASVNDSLSFVGTPSYMSPEQARGEGHRVDGRSDIFSLGVVFYELLTGKRPFRSASRNDLLRQVASFEPKPPRQYDETIPKELERICQKALAKLASDRYTSAHDMADDLRHFLAQQPLSETVATTQPITAHQEGTTRGGDSETVTSGQSSPPSNRSSEQAIESSRLRELRIIPKGIRSFDAHDAGFFLQLLPGARDRDGLPETIRFWKARLEERDAEQTFAVGLIYGPSGCGKSSLVKAGLIPQLSKDIVPLMIEAAPGRTETRLRRALQKNCPTLPEENSLVETIKSLRTGHGPAAEKKVLIVIDQFEQWLHSSKPDQNTELVQALRQCDGSRVQCIIMVRDDFWMAVTHFMRNLEVRISEGQNSAAVDLFPVRHALKVLDAFGRAFEILPDDTKPLNADQKAFLNEAVSGLAEDGKVICVRLSLFAETMRGKSWTPQSLRKVGGTQGVGLAFLEETFSGSSTPPEIRYHQRAARLVLQELLPDSGTNIRGSMRSHEELRIASGYRSPQDFDELIEILDSEIRLITPTDPEGFDDHQEALPQKDQRYFQLTHDYLVPSLRLWLTQKQRETRRGRAQLLLAERAALWQSKPENRYLPTLGETLRIRLLSDKKNRSDAQQAMLTKASRVHAGRIVATFAVLAILVAIGVSIHTRTLIEGLSGAEMSQVQGFVNRIDPLRLWANPLLQERIENPETSDSQRLRLALALLPVDPSQQDYLTQRLCDLNIDEFPIVRDEIASSNAVQEALWQVALDQHQQSDSSQRYRCFQACCALATYASEDQRWTKIAPWVIEYLIGDVPTLHLAKRIDHLQPAKNYLIGDLEQTLASREKSTDSRRERTALSLAQYLQGQPLRIVDAILLCHRRTEFEPLVQALKPDFPQARQQLEVVLQQELEPEPDAQQRDARLRRRAIAAATLAHFGEMSVVLDFLAQTPDPSLRSFISSFFAELPIDYEKLMNVVKDPSLETSKLRPLIQSVGELDVRSIPPANAEQLRQWLLDLQSRHMDSGVHSMAEWSLRKWGMNPAPQPFADSNRETVAIMKQVEQLEEQIETANIGRPNRQLVWEGEIAEKPDPGILDDTDLLLRLNFNDDGSIAAVGSEAPTSLAFAEQAQPRFAAGVFGKALWCDEDNVVNCGDLADLKSTQTFSYGCWFETPDSQFAALFSRMDAANDRRGYDLWLNGRNIAAHLVDDEPNHYIKVVTTAEFAANRWHHVLMTYDGSKKASGVRIYVDGKPAAVVALFDTLEDTIESAAPLMLGTRFGEFPYRGWLDDVRIYGRELTANEVARIFESGIQSIARIPRADRTNEQQLALDHAFPDEPVDRLQSQVDAIMANLPEVKWDQGNKWFVNNQRQTMIVLPAQNGASIDYDFAISACEVTIDQWRRYGFELTIDDTTANSNECPMHNMSWYEAAAYCNWLSDQDHIPRDQWCFLPNKNEIYGEAMEIKENFLSLRGYRFPTHAEWKLAYLSGSQTDYSFGNVNEIADRYGWWGGNASARSHPVGTRLPNDFGIFDLQGNLWEWSLGTPGGIEPLVITNQNERALYGGAFNSVLRNVQINSNTFANPAVRSNYWGFRVVRVIPSTDGGATESNTPAVRE